MGGDDGGVDEVSDAVGDDDEVVCAGNDEQQADGVASRLRRTASGELKGMMGWASGAEGDNGWKRKRGEPEPGGACRFTYTVRRGV